MDWLKEQLGTSYGPALVAGTVALAVSLITGAITLCVAWLNPSITSLRVRRQAVDASFDKAIAAMLLVQTSRNLPTSIDQNTHHGTESEHATFNLNIRETGIKNYFTRIDEAKISLVAVSPYFPDVEDWLGSLEFPEDEDVPRRKRLQAARVPAIKSERLWGRRKTVERTTPRPIISPEGTGSQ